MEEPYYLGPNIKRLLAGRTQRWLAERVPMREDLLSKYIRGVYKNMPATMADRIADLLETTSRALHAPPGSAQPTSLIERQEMQQIAEEAAEKVFERRLAASSNQIHTSFRIAPRDKFDRMGAHNTKGMARPYGTKLAKVHGLRASADAGRFLLHDEGREEPIGEVMYDESLQSHEGSEVVGLWVQGDCLAPVVADGALILVEVERPGFPMADLESAVGDAVFACVGEAVHVKFLLRADDGYVLAPLNGEPPIPVDEDVRVFGVVIEQRSRPRWPGKQ